ncbi:hypothetical protein [Oceanicola sp. 502str15]|uniref:hypothetical protein n=1 Tax=Oceanicola sp. 502str15 TaxID=2696061 RepID=UPI002095BA5A|nr:hypothetical protein [Oceanicola sp. 502str15]MCO6381403.1 hypothetical protein [Oceanicola sp. 502str15]
MQDLTTNSEAIISPPFTVSPAEVDRARARDTLTGRAFNDLFLDEMLADPLVRLVMKADGVSAAHLRLLYAGGGAAESASAAPIRTAAKDGKPARLARPVPSHPRQLVKEM